MRILGTGSALPAHTLTNDDLSKFLDTSDEWIRTHTGIRSRQVITDETLLQLAARAANAALENSGLAAADIDYILASSVLPDTITPSLGCLLQAEIGANCPALDVNAACAGFLYALDLADALTSSGKANRVLVVCAEGMTRMVDWTDRSTCVLFGDGAGAAVVDGGEGGLMATLLTSQGDATHLNMYPDPGNSPFATCRVPAREAGVSPDCAAGFSLGEVAAMAFAGVMDFDEAFRFVIKRAEEMQSCAEKYPGAMGAVLRLMPAQVEDICRAFPDKAFPVNYNCPGQTVVACAVEVYDELSAKVTEARGRMLRLNVSGAFHTPWMGEAAEALRAYLANKPTRVPELPLYANATAQPYGDDAAHLLSTQVCHPVRWQESVERMAEAGVDTFIEVGAGKTLSGLIRKTIPGAAIFNVEKPEDLQKLSEVRA